MPRPIQVRERGDVDTVRRDREEAYARYQAAHADPIIGAGAGLTAPAADGGGITDPEVSVWVAHQVSIMDNLVMDAMEACRSTDAR